MKFRPRLPYKLTLGLQDAAAPVYAEMLEMATVRMGPCAEFYSLWPLADVDEPWRSLQKAVFQHVCQPIRSIALQACKKQAFQADHIQMWLLHQPPIIFAVGCRSA